MLDRLKKDEKGFTIIEVLIVLAIAGLIMLIVFLAIPALQRNQRNNARNSEASRISTAVTECLANRNGQADSCREAGATSRTTALANLGISESSDTPPVLNGYQQITNLTFNTLSNGNAPAPRGDDDAGLRTANISFATKCSPDGATVRTGTQREFTVTWRNEPDVPRCIGSESN